MNKIWIVEKVADFFEDNEPMGYFTNECDAYRYKDECCDDFPEENFRVHGPIVPVVKAT